MTHVIDYSILFAHKPHLRLVYSTNELRPWRILDALSDDQLYARASTLAQAVQFMRAAARKGDASIDELSVEFHLRLADPGVWSVRVGALSERGYVSSEERLSAAAVIQAVPPRRQTAPRSENVLPFRRPLEPLDEEVRA